MVTSTVSFEETGAPNTLGMFLDDVDCTFCISDATVTDLVYGRKNIDVGTAVGRAVIGGPHEPHTV